MQRLAVFCLLLCLGPHVTAAELMQAADLDALKSPAPDLRIRYHFEVIAPGTTSWPSVLEVSAAAFGRLGAR
ncbi:MAG: hypothetical protein AAGE01_14660 [Pseudomonadota bacterium]